MSFYAWVDESGSDAAADPHTYILAAAVCAGDAVDDARGAMESLRLVGQRKVHWRDESDKRRLHLVESVAAIGLEHLVVVRDGRVDERPERRRRHCLERLFHELAQLGVESATVESRGPKDDERDSKMLDYMRRKGVLAGAALHVQHRAGPADPLLWAPDVVCGAVTRDRVGDASYLRVLQRKLEIILIELRH